MLLESKANVKAVESSKNTALHLACQRRHAAAAALLLDRIEALGAEGEDGQKQQLLVINMANKQQKTPLHVAARNGLVYVCYS